VDVGSGGGVEEGPCNILPNMPPPVLLEDWSPNKRPTGPGDELDEGGSAATEVGGTALVIPEGGTEEEEVAVSDEDEGEEDDGFPLTMSPVFYETRIIKKKKTYPKHRAGLSCGP